MYNSQYSPIMSESVSHRVPSCGHTINNIYSGDVTDQSPPTQPSQ